MSALTRHIADQQTIMGRLCDLLELLEACALDGVVPTAQPTLVQLAKEMALEVNNNLDSINLPKEERA